MKTEENIFAGLPNNKIVFKAITPAHVNNPVRSWMSKAAKKVLDELTAKKKNGTLKVVNLIEHPEQAPSVNPILKAKELAEKVADNFCAKFSVWMASTDYQALKDNLVEEILTTLNPEQLLKDEQRLNWLEKEDKKTNLGCLYAGARPPIKGAGSEGGLSIRTAIDSAIAQQKEKKV